MKIAERQVGNVTIIDLQGKIMYGDGDQALRDAINHAIEEVRPRIILNMAEVPYVDSAGLSEIVRGYVSLNNMAGRLKLLDVTNKVHDLLTITKLVTVFETFESEEKAVDSFA